VRRFDERILGALLLPAGLALLGVWIGLRAAPPVEEPASPGQSPGAAALVGRHRAE
jgi:hypothetical protein